MILLVYIPQFELNQHNTPTQLTGYYDAMQFYYHSQFRVVNVT